MSASSLLFLYRRWSACDTSWLAEFPIPGCFSIWDVVAAGKEKGELKQTSKA